MPEPVEAQRKSTERADTPSAAPAESATAALLNGGSHAGALTQTSQTLNVAPHLRGHRSLAAQLARSPVPRRTMGNDTVQRANATGLPDNLKAGIEGLSGIALDDVRVHRNSSSPAQLQAHAYAQGNDIHLAPGQDHHLPHEAWHVVQQKQGRVRATRQLKAGVPINDDSGLENEADVMGARAVARPPRPAVLPGNGFAAPTAPAPIQAVWVKKKKAHGKGTTELYVAADEGEDGAVDTKTMKFSERQRVRADLKDAKGGKNISAREGLDSEIATIAGKIDEKGILALGKTLDRLKAEKQRGALSDESEEQLQELSFRVLRSLDFLGGFDEADSDAVRFRLLLQSYIEQISTVDATALGTAAAHAESNADLVVTGEDVAAYRADIAERGTWGGGAEATVIATAFNFRCRLLILDSENKYVLVDTIGPANLRTRSLLNVGGHYEVVGNAAVPGQAYDAAHVLYEAPGDGDCLFWALFNVAANGAATVLDVNPVNPPATPLNAEQFIVRARQIVSTGLTQPQIENTIVEMRLSGSRAGLGPRLAKRMNLQNGGKDQLRRRLARTGKTDAALFDMAMTKLSRSSFAATFSKAKTLEDLLSAYGKGRASLLEEAPDTDDAKAIKQRRGLANGMDELGNVLLAVAAENMPSIDSDLVTSEGQDTAVETELRKDSAEQLRRAGITVKPSSFKSAQLIITRDDTEYVMDRIGQLVPRYVDRGISAFNQAELDEEDYMYPTGESPLRNDKRYPKELRDEFADQSTTSGSGIGDNKIKASREMGHVEGVKPSPFMSTTAIAGGTVNPQGVSFGSSLYTIDLAYLPPNAIAAVYTDRGMGYYLLSAFKGGKGEKAKLIAGARDYENRQTTTREQKKKKPTTTVFDATAAAKDNPALSGKEWQALMDVVRTGEVLISAPIPKAAMTKK